MLIEFAIDPSALKALGGPLWLTTDAHERCIRYGLRYGILIHSGSELVNSDIWKAVEGLPQQQKTLWQTAFKKMRTRKGPDGWLGLSHEDSLEGIQHLCADVRVACLEETRALIVGMPENESIFRVPPDGPEIVRLSSIDHATSFKEAEAASGQPIPEGLKISELWKVRFSDIAAISRNISIIDRYSVENLNNQKLGLQRLLKEIDGSASGAKVSIFSALKDFSAVDLERLVRSISLGRGGVSEIEVFLVLDRDFGQQAHDRFLRFGDDVFEIGIGVEVFDGSKVRRQSLFSFKMQGTLHKSTEKSLKQKTVHTFRHSPR